MKKSRKITIFVTTTLVLFMGTIVVYAVASNTEKSVVNPLTPAKIELAVVETSNKTNVSPVIEEEYTWEGDDEDSYTAEKNVAVRNVYQTDENNADAYVRVCLVPAWTAQMDDGTPVVIAPNAYGLADFSAMTGLTIENDMFTLGDVTFTLDSDWANYWRYCPTDGFFYYKTPISAGQTTQWLLESVSIDAKTHTTLNANDITLSIDVLVDGIQTEGGAIETRWQNVRIASDKTLALASD